MPVRHRRSAAPLLARGAMAMPDPTTIWRDFHDWLTWYERQKGGRRHRRRRMDQRAVMAELQAAADETYRLAICEILQVTATPIFVPGLLNSPPGMPLQQWELAACRLGLIPRFERQGARIEEWADVALNSRTTGGPRYHDLRFRLAEPQELDKYLAGKPLRQPVIRDPTLVTLLLTDDVFQRHRDEREPLAANLVQVVAVLRFPNLAIPGDSVRLALRDKQVVERYGDPRRGPPKAWARVLFNSLKKELTALKKNSTAK
jgi:hypothetical protein